MKPETITALLEKLNSFIQREANRLQSLYSFHRDATKLISVLKEHAETLQANIVAEETKPKDKDEEKQRKQRFKVIGMETERDATKQVEGKISRCLGILEVIPRLVGPDLSEFKKHAKLEKVEFSKLSEKPENHPYEIAYGFLNIIGTKTFHDILDTIGFVYIQFDDLVKILASVKETKYLTKSLAAAEINISALETQLGVVTFIGVYQEFGKDIRSILKSEPDCEEKNILDAVAELIIRISTTSTTYNNTYIKLGDFQQSNTRKGADVDLDNCFKLLAPTQQKLNENIRKLMGLKKKIQQTSVDGKTKERTEKKQQDLIKNNRHALRVVYEGIIKKLTKTNLNITSFGTYDNPVLATMHKKDEKSMSTNETLDDSELLSLAPQITSSQLYDPNQEPVVRFVNLLITLNGLSKHLIQHQEMTILLSQQICQKLNLADDTFGRIIEKPWKRAIKFNNPELLQLLFDRKLANPKDAFQYVFGDSSDTHGTFVETRTVDPKVRDVIISANVQLQHDNANSSHSSPTTPRTESPIKAKLPQLDAVAETEDKPRKRSMSQRLFQGFKGVIKASLGTTESPTSPRKTPGNSISLNAPSFVVVSNYSSSEDTSSSSSEEQIDTTNKATTAPAAATTTPTETTTQQVVQKLGGTPPIVAPAPTLAAVKSAPSAAGGRIYNNPTNTANPEPAPQTNNSIDGQSIDRKAAFAKFAGK